MFAGFKFLFSKTGKGTLPKDLAVGGTMRNVKTKYSITNEITFAVERIHCLLSRLSISPKVKREIKKTNPPI